MQCFKPLLNGLHFCTNINLFEYNSAFHAAFRKPQCPPSHSPWTLPSAWTSNCSLQPLCYSAQSSSAATWIATSEPPHSELGQNYCREDNFSAEDTTHNTAKNSITESRKLKTYFVLTEFKFVTSPLLSPVFFPTFVSYMVLSQRWYLTSSCLNFTFPALDQFSHFSVPPPLVPDCCSWCLQHVHSVGPQSTPVGAAGAGKVQPGDGLLSNNQGS